jgi:hypothetical protein
MEFEEIKNVNIETIGSLSQITRPCPIKYKSMKVQHPQVQLDRRQTLTEFIKEGEVNLKQSEQYVSLVLLVVLINCMAVSNGRVTTALSVHGTTVIHIGLLVNHILSS